MTVDAVSLSAAIGKQVSELHVALAKHELQGVDLATMAEIFACDESEIATETQTSDYQETKRAVAMQLAQFSADTDISWDSLEHASLQKLSQVAKYSSDPEFHLKVAVMANKAQRRHRNHAEALNPAAVGTRVNLTLTERFVQKLQNGGQMTQERRIDIQKASELRVSPKDIQKFLAPRIETSRISDALNDVFDFDQQNYAAA